MDHLHKLYTVLKTPSIDISDVKGTDLSRFMDISLSSAEKINKEPNLKQQITNELHAHLEQDNTLERTIDIMFESAVKTCLIEKERELIRWLQVCVSEAVQYKLEGVDRKEPIKQTSSSRSVVPRSPRKKKSSKDEDAYVLSDTEEEEEEAVVPVKKTTTRKKKLVVEQEVEDLEVPSTSSPRKSPRKSSPKKKPVEVDSADEDDDTDISWDGASDDDDDYKPTTDDDNDHDHVAPTTTKTRPDDEETSSSKPKVSRKKKPASPPAVRRKPLKEATLPVIKDGAGSKAIAKYFLDMEGPLSAGYFAKSFFFPSHDSFNAFISALNSATKTIDICVFAFTDDQVVETLTAAKDRGVKIKIITDNQQAAGKGADVKNLYESHGIPFRTDKTNGYMHNKFAIIDSATLINGSFNWSKGARFKNKENIIITNIPLCINEFQIEFDSLWEEFA